MSNGYLVHDADEAVGHVDVRNLYLVTFNGTFSNEMSTPDEKNYRTADYPDIELLTAAEAVNLANAYNNDEFRPEFKVWAEPISYRELWRRRNMECDEANTASRKKWLKEREAMKAARRRKRLANAKKRAGQRKPAVK